MSITNHLKAVVICARGMEFCIGGRVRAVSRDTTPDFAKEALHEWFEEWEAAADNGDIEFEASPDGFLGA
jgi:hypothetical protein